jgi:uncharacterized membrane protein SpoIIM required for sporulation
MVLELLTNPLSAEKAPWNMFFIGILYASVAVFLSNWIFREHASMIMVFLTVLACVPLLYHTLKLEEKKDVELKVGELGLLKEHGKALNFLIFLFLGCTLAFAFWYVVLSPSLVQSTFSAQTATIQAINTKITGNVTGFGVFTKILLNNFKVLIFCVLFSFLYGAGALFILTWNSSVIAAAIGNYIRTHLSNITGEYGLAKVSAYLSVVSLGLLRYLFHGIPEIVAYFIAGLAGGIISVAVIKESFGSKNFEKVILDSSDLILISIGVLVVAAYMEVYITPLFF